MNESETRYLELLLAPLDKCADYTPKFGSDRSKSVTLETFKELYRLDPFYHWVGLDSELMYAAHKAAGGMTSIYRQLGKGCEQLFRAIIQDSFGFIEQQVVWSYEIEKKDKTKASLTLDARIDIEHIQNEEKKSRVKEWLERSGRFLKLNPERIGQLRGAVFEVRQGYKSADAKRSNADLGFGMNAASENYIPVLAIVSTQASVAVLRRYRNNKMLVMTGAVMVEDDTSSTFAFFKNVVGYELDKFFERNTNVMRARCNRVLEALLSVKQTTHAGTTTAEVS
jgi:hypothetical protein